MWRERQNAAVCCWLLKQEQEASRSVLSLIPEDSELHRRWTAAVRHEKLPPNYWESAFICSAHFVVGNIERDMQAELMGVQRPRKMKRDTVPSVFPHKPPPAKRKCSVYLECKNILQVYLVVSASTGGVFLLRLTHGRLIFVR